MKRPWAAGLLVVLAALCLAVPRGSALTGSWETTVEMSPGEETTAVTLRYTFSRDGRYTCAMTRAGDSLADGVSMGGRYVALRDRLFLSQGEDYRIELSVWEPYRLEGDTLTLPGNDNAGEPYPLTLGRVPEP